MTLFLKSVYVGLQLVDNEYVCKRLIFADICRIIKNEFLYLGMLKGGRGVQLGDYCMNVGAFCPNITSHEQFIDELFTAAGSKLYISVSYKRKLYTGNKLFIDKVKNDHSLRGRSNFQTLKDFFLSNIPDDKALDVLLKFGVPLPIKNKKILVSLRKTKVCSSQFIRGIALLFPLAHVTR